MLPDRVIAAVNVLYEAGYDRTAWEEGLSQLCGSIGAAASAIMPRSEAENTLHLPYSSDLTDCFERYASEGWYRRDLRAIRGWVLSDKGQRVILEQDMMGEDDHRREPFYQELIIPYAYRWAANVTFDTPSGGYVFSLFNSDKRGAFSEQDRKLLDILWNHVARAVTISERFGTMHNGMGLDVLEATGEAAILLDWRGKVIGLTKPAEALVADELIIRGGILTGVRSRVASLVQGVVERALAEGVPGQAPLWIERDGKRPLIVDFLPVPEAYTGVFMFARLMVLLVDLDKAPRPRDEVLRAGFRLTPKEATIALDLLDGMSLTDAAERSAMSRETAKTHLKSIFYKTNTNRQSELVRLLQTVAKRI